MIDIIIDNIHKSYGGKEVLRGVSFQVQQGEHVALLGRNGAGKTTLFRLLGGEEKPDTGTVTLGAGKSVGILSQIPDFPPGYTALDVLRKAFAPLLSLQAELEDMAKRLDTEPGLLSSYGTLQQRFEFLGGYEQDLRLRRIRQGLSLHDSLCLRPFTTLSGGEKTRVNLGRLMLCDPGILLLDEPTNHLDLSAVEWLEDYLSAYRGTVLLISHDRFFLDNTVSRVVELEEGRALLWNGNYSAYAEQKERHNEEELRRYERNERERRRLEDTARRMHEYAGKNAKLHRRAFAIEKRAARVPAAERPHRQARLRQKFHTRPFLADDLLRASELSKAYGGRVILRDLTLTLGPGERVALLGDNGAGKSTLLRLLLGGEQPDTGSVKLAERCKTAFLPQAPEFSHPERSLLDTMLYETGCDVRTARDRLGAFHFRGDEVFGQVSTLSGGERSRLFLCILMNDDISFLVLDEPTNHLDIASREWLETALEDYGGSLLFVSHDRYFISRFATRLWILADGAIRDFHGSYEDYRQWLLLSREEESAAKAAADSAPVKTAGEPAAAKNPSSRDARADERRKRVMERELADLERQEKALDAEMEDAAHDAERLLSLMSAKEELVRRWGELYSQWEKEG